MTSRRVIRRLARGAAVATAVILLLLAGAAGFLLTALPQTSGEIDLAPETGLGAPTRIVRDADGLVRIEAASVSDAMFALGFAHAQDRLFQMDLQRRLGAGRLAEIFGRGALDNDRQMRLLGLYRDAEASVAAQSPEFRRVLDAYSAGVNAWMKQARGALPLEFYLLGYGPEPWTPADSLLYGKLMDLQLTGNYTGELARAALAARIPAERLRELFPGYPSDGPVTLAASLQPGVLERLADLAAARFGPVYASNNWVLAGSRTLSGKPLLANDPHLGLNAPGPWYLVRIEAPGLSLAGATAPGTPLVLLGHNDRIAWGLTTTTGDVQDSFVETVDPENPDRYLTPDGPRPFEHRTETIKVRFGGSVTMDVRRTRHGPVVSDLGGGQGLLAAGQVLALQTTFLTGDDPTASAVWAVDRARDWGSFTAALEPFLAPQQNWVYGDVDGNIGFYAPARIPLRRAGDGSLPSPGADGSHDWIGSIPFAELPHGFNPASGRFFTANNKIVPDSYPYFISEDWDLPYRAERIATLIDATAKHTPDTMAAMQRDILSLSSRELLPVLLAAPASDDAGRQAQALLARWNGTMDRDRPEPLLYTAWFRALDRDILDYALGGLSRYAGNPNPHFLAKALTEGTVWCGPPGCPARIVTALGEALASLRAAYGPEMTAWRWGTAHPASFASLPFTFVPGLRDLFDLQIPAGGGFDTINAAASRLSSREPYADVHGPGLRAIYDLADLDRSRFMIAPGQSGQRLSSHYGDMVERWRDGAYVTLPGSGGGEVLTLRPAR